MVIEPVQPAGLPTPKGHYSAGIAQGDLLFVSGQLPVLPDGSHALAEADFETQCRQVFANLFAVLAAGGSAPDRVLKTTIFITDMADWPLCNTIYAELFGDHKPARSIVPVGPLHFGYGIEVEAVAARG